MPGSTRTRRGSQRCATTGWPGSRTPTATSTRSSKPDQRPLLTSQDRRDAWLWIGGGSAAGKSTVARRLAEEHGLQVCATDEAMSRHARALSAEEAPYLGRFRAMTMDERWVDRSPQVMLDTFHWYRG